MEATLSPFFIHRSPERRSFYSSAPTIFWSEQLACWVTADRPTILSILKDKNFAAVDFERETARLAERFGIDLNATKELLAKIPLGQEGREHAAVRKEMALNINARSAEALRQYSEFIDREVPQLFREKTSFDIVSGVFSPSVRRLMSTLSGVSPDTPPGDISLPLIFDRMLSLNRRKLLDRHIDTTIRAHASRCPIGEVLLNTALTVVGSDSILGSLSESFVSEIERNAGKRMDEISWNEKLPVTAVPYVERIATKAATVDGRAIEKAQRVRLCLDAFGSGQASDLDFYFGSGRHVCLGKALSLQAWQKLTSVLGVIDKRVAIKNVTYRKSDFLFNTPTIVEIAVSHD